MKVLQFNSRRLFGKFSPGTPDPVPQGLLIAVAITLISWVPAIVVALAMDSRLPLYAFAVRDLLGLLVGILIYRRSYNSPISCMSMHEDPDLPVEEIKKAA